MKKFPANIPLATARTTPKRTERNLPKVSWEVHKKLIIWLASAQ